MTKKKTGHATALAVRKTAALRVVPGLTKLMKAAVDKLSLPMPRIDKDYSIPLVRREHTLWLKFTDKTGLVTWKPYVTHQGLVDVLHQRGYKKLVTMRLPSIPCRAAGCYGATEADFTQVYQCTVVLKTGQEVSMSADACRHNTSSMIHGDARTRANAIARMAETRSIGRVLSRALNIGAAAILELPEVTAAQVWKKGDRIMAKGEVETIIDADFKVATGAAQPATHAAQPTPIQGPATEAATAKAKEAADAAWKEANTALHAEVGRLGLPVDGCHAYIHARSAEALKRPVASIKELSAEDLRKWVVYFRDLKPSHAKMLKAWMDDHAKKTGGKDGA